MTTRTRLVTTVFRPDVWFVMPPACNVVFPEECTNVSYSRQMMRETTRLELQTFTGILTDQTQNAAAQLIQQYYFAPALIDDSGLPTLPDQIGNGKTEDGTFPSTAPDEQPLTNVMYIHEKFSGIIPKIERISDTSFYSAIEANKNSGTGVTADSVTTVQQYAQRVALFNFLRNRYLARQANVSGTFMPRIVAGFPALVVNRPKESDTDDPTHFIGMITNVTHTLNQEGGTTSFALAYARPHTIASEEESFLRFLAAMAEDIPAQTTDAAYPTQQEDLNTLNLQLRTVASKMTNEGEDPIADLYVPLSQGDFEAANLKAGEFGVVLFKAGIDVSAFSATVVLINRADLTQTYTYEELFGEEALLDDAGSTAFRAAFGIAKDDTAESFANSSGWSASDEVDGLADASGLVYPVVIAFSLTEAAKTVTRSFEELMTPPWFSDAYMNANISSYYKRLLGCASMGDQFGDTSSVENAARKVVSSYSTQANVKSNAGDPEFIYLNTKREIPTQAQVLEFHRFAFTDSSNAPLYGLDKSGGGVKEDDPGRPVARDRVHTSEELLLSGFGILDPRQERRSAVKSYQDQLLGRRAFRG